MPIEAVMLLSVLTDPAPFSWACPHWGWFFCGFAAGAILVLLTHRVRG